jgi:hypothetical protein
LKADGTTVEDSCRLAIYRFGQHEPAAIVGVCHSASRVLNARASTHRRKQRIIEFLRPGYVVTPDHDVAEHRVLSSLSRLHTLLAFFAGVAIMMRFGWQGKLG